MKDTDEHARENAAAWLGSIIEMVDALNAAGAADLPEEAQLDVEAADQRITESVLSVEVRSGWGAPGGEQEPQEYRILLGTGGPAVQLRGALNAYFEPDTVTMEYQDWGTPWTEYRATVAETDAMLAFARRFWFGE